MQVPTHFIPDREPPGFYPLGSYLAAPSPGVAAEYIASLTQPGDLVVDPFASRPTVARAALGLGRRVIAVESNPLWSWLARTMATLAPAAEINAALAQLGDALKDDVPLRTHINRMYVTVCAACHQLTPADYFIYARDAGPISRRYTCAHCGQTRDDSATADDQRRASEFQPHGLHYHYAFERLVPAENLHAGRIRRMLDLYTPRNLQALVALTSKIDALFHATRERDILLLLLLHLLDRGASLYAAPDAPAQLAAHKQFVEFNLWREMERAAVALGEQGPAPLGDLANTTADVLTATEPCAFMNRGSVKSLARAIPAESAALILSGPPVRKLGVWALSYCWGAWILGRAAVESLIPSLDPHKNDPLWERRWYLETMSTFMQSIAKLLRLESHAVLVFDETSHEVVDTLMLAAAGARLELETIIFQPALGDVARREFDSMGGHYRVAFARRKVAPLKLLAEARLAEKIRAGALAAGRQVLTRRGEPLAYSWLHHAALAHAAREGYLAQVMSTNTKVPPNRFVFYAVREGLAQGYAHDLDHYETADQSVWLRHGPLEPVLVDRVEDAVCRLFRSRGPLAQRELLDALYREFPEDLTPEAGLVELCARTYADEREDTWYPRSENLPAEKSHALDLLARLGERMECRVASGPAPFDLTWEWGGEIARGFVWREHARVQEFIKGPLGATHGYVVVPETRVPLLSERVRRLAPQADAFYQAGWNFVRVPFVEQLLLQDKLERNDLLLITGLVPPLAGERAQLELF